MHASTTFKKLDHYAAQFRQGNVHLITPYFESFSCTPYASRQNPNTSPFGGKTGGQTPPRAAKAGARFHAPCEKFWSFFDLIDKSSINSSNRSMGKIKSFVAPLAQEGGHQEVHQYPDHQSLPTKKGSCHGVTSSSQPGSKRTFCQRDSSFSEEDEPAQMDMAGQEELGEPVPATTEKKKNKGHSQIQCESGIHHCHPQRPQQPSRLRVVCTPWTRLA